MYQHVLDNTRHRFGQNSSLLDLIITNYQYTFNSVETGDKLVALMFNINCEVDFENVSLPRKNFFKGDFTSRKLTLMM